MMYASLLACLMTQNLHTQLYGYVRHHSGHFTNLQIYKLFELQECVLPTNCIIISSNRYQVSIRPEFLEGKESNLGFNPSLYHKCLTQARYLEQSMCLINVCGSNNMNNYSSSPHPTSFFH